MKILVAGSGGREHALAWRLARCTDTKVYAVPGNPGAAAVADCLPTQDSSPASILGAAKALGADLTVIGPEAPLVAGVVDLFQNTGLPIVGPTAACAQLEGSKVYAKHFFRQHGLPTAEFVTVSTVEEGIAALDRFSFPVVIKADGLASGKGVVIAHDRADAEAAVQALGPMLVIEEYLKGPEISFIALCDGKNVAPLLPSRDYKRIYDGDAGPNTGGMGAICDPELLEPGLTATILDTIIRPTVDATGYTGFLYAGLILTEDGPKLLEFNVRLGDPETQAILVQLETDLAQLLLASANRQLPSSPLRWRPGASACVVMAADGYPGNPRTGDSISGIDLAQRQGAAVFHAGTRLGWSGVTTAGGRVLGITATGQSRLEAVKRAYAAVEKIEFRGMQYRKDIGL